MRAYIFPCLAIMLAFIGSLAAGCGPAYRGDVRRMAEADEWDAAASMLRQVVDTDPGDAWAWRELGHSHLKLGAFEQARTALERSDAIRPQQGETLFYLGATSEALGNLPRAIEYYTACAVSPDLSYEAQDRIRARIYLLKRDVYRHQAAKLVDRRLEYPIEENVIAVYDFSTSDAEGAPSGVGRALAALIIADLQNVRDLTLVERLELQAILAEIERAQQNRQDLEAGKIIGAEKSVTGNIFMPGGEKLEVAHYLLQNDDGRLLGDGTEAGDLAELMALEKDVVWSVIEHLELVLSEEERQAIGVVATRNLPAFLAYARGIVLEDEEDYLGARRQYEEALSHDPDFNDAELRIERMSGIEDVVGDVAGTVSSIEGVGLAAAPTSSDVIFQRHTSQVHTAGAMPLDLEETGTGSTMASIGVTDPPRIEIPPVSEAAIITVEITAP